MLRPAPADLGMAGNGNLKARGERHGPDVASLGLAAPAGPPRTDRRAHAPPAAGALAGLARLALLVIDKLSKLARGAVRPGRPGR